MASYSNDTHSDSGIHELYQRYSQVRTTFRNVHDSLLDD